MNIICAATLICGVVTSGKMVIACIIMSGVVIVIHHLI